MHGVQYVLLLYFGRSQREISTEVDNQVNQSIKSWAVRLSRVHTHLVNLWTVHWAAAWPLTAGRQRPGLISSKDTNSWTDTGGWSSSLSSPTMTREINEHVCLSVHTHIVGDHSLDGNYTWQNPWFLTWTLQASGWRFHSFIQNMQFSATHVMAFQSSLTRPENKTIRDIWLRPEVTRSVWCVCVCARPTSVKSHSKTPPKKGF